ncbi:DUF4139 domain-containing protein [Roseomonas sp. NAR14]|uniref:DUF4139 domain-containing protein n=2 Tax=Roseomonas acroporae TaxID=2937791 RepID=A0A9X1YAM3_9PROT|nr:DUF4139 domain-containing protein [Roseomonas acroporae]
MVPPADAPADAQARLQGWAVVENRSGADWDGVRLSLVSGNPAAYHQPLYAPILVQRPELPVRVPEAVRVQPDTGGRPPPPPPPAVVPYDARQMAEAERMRGYAAQAYRGAAPAIAMPAPAAPMGGAAAAVDTATAAASAGRVAFTLANPVTIRAGETANVPFLDARLPADRVWWVQDFSARNPLQAVRLRNATNETLPDGLATVYGTGSGAEDGAFLGDAELRAVQPGETRLLAFGRDRDVQMTGSTGQVDNPTRFELRRGGVAVVSFLRRDERALAIDPRGARGRIVIDLPRVQGAEPRFTVASEGDFGLRHEAVLDGTPTTLRFAWEREYRREMPLWDPGLGDPALLRWRDFDVEANLRRLPGGPATSDALGVYAGRMPENAPGRAELLATVAAYGELRELLDKARAAIRAYATADVALNRARQAVEDRSGPEREEARRRLNRASQGVESAGTAADAAWDAWVARLQALLARGG